MVLVVLAEFTLITKRKFNLVIDFRSYTGAKFHTETVKGFTFNRISRTVSQGYDWINIIIKQVVSRGNSGFRLNVHTIGQLKVFADFGSDNTGQNVAVIGRYTLVGRIFISILLDMNVTQSSFRCNA